MNKSNARKQELHTGFFVLSVFICVHPWFHVEV
jgi:hypothetical protein